MRLAGVRPGGTDTSVILDGGVTNVSQSSGVGPVAKLLRCDVLPPLELGWLAKYRELLMAAFP